MAYLGFYTLSQDSQYRNMLRIALAERATQIAGETQVNAPQAVVSITQANPAVVEVTGHGLANGRQVIMQDIAGMTELEGVVASIGGITTDTFTLTGIDSTSFGAYTGGGTAAVQKTLEEWQKRAAFAANLLSAQVPPNGTSFLSGIDVWLETFAVAVAQNPVIGGESIPYADTTQHDNDLDFQIDAVWSDLAGVTGQDLT